MWIFDVVLGLLIFEVITGVVTKIYTKIDEYEITEENTVEKDSFVINWYEILGTDLFFDNPELQAFYENDLHKLGLYNPNNFMGTVVIDNSESVIFKDSTCTIEYDSLDSFNGGYFSKSYNPMTLEEKKKLTKKRKADSNYCKDPSFPIYEYKLSDDYFRLLSFLKRKNN